MLFFPCQNKYKKKQKLLLASKMRTCSRIFGACGQRHFVYCIARFLQNLSTFLGYPSSANQYAWYLAVKALVLRLRSIWCPHWNHMNVNFRITRNNICSIRNANTSISGIHVTFCSIMYQRQFALPAGNLFTKRIRVAPDLSSVRFSARRAFGKTEVIAERIHPYMKQS